LPEFVNHGAQNLLVQVGGDCGIVLFNRKRRSIAIDDRLGGRRHHQFAITRLQQINN